jgi:ATP-dependent RNA helicase RhlE
MPSFADLKLNKQLLTALEEAGFTDPTPIQEKAIPPILNGQDVLGIAQTGTGKTAAYVLPLLMKVKFAQGMHPRAIILAPTRELAIQISDHLQALSKYTDLRHTVVYGGIGPKTQIENIQKGIDILVATPGRLIDIYSKGELYLRDVKTLVLDEADRMLDMGFMPQIRRMLEIIPSKRQNLLFSATFPEKVEKFSFEFLDFPTRIEVTPQATPVETVEQRLYFVPNFKTKINLLDHLLSNEEVTKAIIFATTKEAAENIFKFITRKVTTRVKVIHANKGQNTRINSLDAFKTEEIRFLVATDVAARGIDVSMVSHVINFDVPVIHEDYVHRIGRTGRAHHLGVAITFANDAEKTHIKKIEQIIKMTIPLFQLPAEVAIEETPFEENQEMKRAIDEHKKRLDPTFKGAFHEKKMKNQYSAPAKKKKK